MNQREKCNGKTDILTVDGRLNTLQHRLTPRRQLILWTDRLKQLLHHHLYTSQDRSYTHHRTGVI